MNVLNTLSLTLITQACETFLIQDTHQEYIPAQFRILLAKPVENTTDVYKRMKLLRRLISLNGGKNTPVTLHNWVAAASRYLLLMKGIRSNSRISRIEEDVLNAEPIVRTRSAEMPNAVVNGMRTFVATAIGALFWLWTGWTSGSTAMLMITVVTALAMRTPNPLMMAKDFLYGMLLALPLSTLYYKFLIPATQQSLLLLCLVLGILAFVSGIFIQRRQLGTMGAFVGTLNVLMLDNPMQLNTYFFLDNALGQAIGCFLALLVILLIRDTSKDRIGQTLLNRFMYSAVSALSTRKKRRDHLPALYQQLFMLLNIFPGDVDKFRLALMLIIGHQRLQDAEIPVNDDLSGFHKQLRHTAERVIWVRSESKRDYYVRRLLKEFDIYQGKLEQYNAPASVIGSVTHLTTMLKKYQHTLIRN